MYLFRIYGSVSSLKKSKVFQRERERLMGELLFIAAITWVITGNRHSATLNGPVKRNNCSLLLHFYFKHIS